MVHVTGTNGKGSTTAIAAALLTETGRRVGTFTSPDLHRVHERITVAGEPIDDESLASLLARLRDLEASSGRRLTRFELLTVGAMLHFADEGVEVAVVEVGVGGTWDATNAVDGRVAVITNVSLDHTEVLGDTVEAIATDKAGIVKPGSTAVLGDPVRATVELQAALATARGASAVWRRGEELTLDRNELAVGGRLVSLTTPLGTHPDVFVSLHGAHQGANALCAVAAVEAFDGAALGEAVLAGALGTVRVPGRLEVVATGPLVVLDAAHNPAGTEVLATAIEESFSSIGPIRVVVGMLSNRDPVDLLAPLAAMAPTEVVCCSAPTPRSLDPGDLAAAARSLGLRADVVADPADAVDVAVARSGGDGVVVVTGSFYVVGAARAHLLGLPPHRG